MFYLESDLLPISALQHLLFCERQCALIHVEQLWVENRFTAEGSVLHKKAHDGEPETRDGERITRGLRLRSLQYGLTGAADIVLWRPPEGGDFQGRTLAEKIQNAMSDGLVGWCIRPVEYKRGKPKANDCDRVQLCAQAICLEEMLGVTVGTGDLYYGRIRHRIEVDMDARLRDITIAATHRLHDLIQRGCTPRATYEKKCDTCSLYSLCLPKAIGRRSVQRFFEQGLSESLQG